MKKINIKANTLSLATKAIAVLLALTAGIASLWVHAIPIPHILMVCTFIAASYLPVDISKMREAGEDHE